MRLSRVLVMLVRCKNEENTLFEVSQGRKGGWEALHSQAADFNFKRRLGKKKPIQGIVMCAKGEENNRNK